MTVYDNAYCSDRFGFVFEATYFYFCTKYVSLVRIDFCRYLSCAGGLSDGQTNWIKIALFSVCHSCVWLVASCAGG